jgi:hypothetical protein
MEAEEARMSNRLERWRRRTQSELPTVTVCRGGDCGSRRKHPGFDHVEQLRRIRGELDGTAASVVVSRCQDLCAFSNVVRVTPGRRGRDAGVRPVWMGRMLDDAATDSLVEWVRTTGAAARPTAALADHVIG